MPHINNVFAFLLIVFWGLTLNSQQLTVINQFDSILNHKELFYFTLKLDDDTTLYFNSLKDSLNFSREMCDSLAEIVISGNQIQTYHNQFKPDQFKKLDTIRIYTIPYYVQYTPIYLIDTQQNIDSLLKYDLNLKNQLDQYGKRYSLTLRVYNAYKLNTKDKKYISKIKRKYCSLLSMKKREIHINYEHKPYICNQNDFFNSGTIIDTQFIESQNTEWIKNQAKKYQLVLWVIVNWEKK